MEQHKKILQLDDRGNPIGSMPWKEQYRFDIRPERMTYPRKQLTHSLAFYEDVNNFLKKPLQGLHTLARFAESRLALCNQYRIKHRVDAPEFNEVRKVFSSIQNYQHTLISINRKRLRFSERENLRKFIKKAHAELLHQVDGLSDFNPPKTACPLYLDKENPPTMPLDDAILLVGILQEAQKAKRIPRHSFLFLTDGILREFNRRINTHKNFKRNLINE